MCMHLCLSGSAYIVVIKFSFIPFQTSLIEIMETWILTKDFRIRLVLGYPKIRKICWPGSSKSRLLEAMLASMFDIDSIRWCHTLIRFSDSIHKFNLLNKETVEFGLPIYIWHSCWKCSFDVYIWSFASIHWLDSLARCWRLKRRLRLCSLRFDV